MKVTTNNKPRPLLDGYELTAKEREYFDYVKDDESYQRFVRYKGALYDVQEFCPIVARPAGSGFNIQVDADSPLLKWSAVQTDTHFSGILMRWHDDEYDQVVMGRYFD